ncbi:DUF2171 domain-containing protein [Roseomonas sp. USHLN139]|uniref:DUF2171 domain-containing protein n=1 Tax=Roseomonas sp. USHLN139 TaxID=3081298 RepID=UPI003B02A12A
MIDRSMIQEHAEVVASCGTPLGRVDHLAGDFIKLTRDSSPDGQHKYLPLSAVADVEGGKVSTIMNHTAATSLLQDEPEAGAGLAVTGS